MPYLKDDGEIAKLYDDAVKESRAWRIDYPEYERLADNGLLEDLDENLPEVNDGSLAASLFKLPKRIISSALTGRAKAMDSDDAWLSELANIQWENNIIKNANSQAPFHRKWKDAVRKSAIYGGQPIITLFTTRGNYTGADFIVPQAQDVRLEPGKVSDYDSDVFFWDVYYSKMQVQAMIEEAEAEKKEAKDSEQAEGYNKWNIPALKAILKECTKTERDSQDDHIGKQGIDVEKGGIKFCVVFQRGVAAPFYMYHKGTKTTVREWQNPDPTGDVPVHYLYCYQDFINPYGIGIVKLAGGTQNVLDYLRQADVQATQLGIRPPVSIAGDTSQTDFDSFVYAQDAQWITGNAVVRREEMSNQIYSQLPTRIGMYKTSLNQLIPVGDTSISGESGDPNYSKTPAGVKFQQASLSIDDEDYKDNLYMTYEAVASSMINTHFANMQGSDLMKLSDDERDLLAQSGLEFPVDEEGNPTNELEIIWDEARGSFSFEVEAEEDDASANKDKIDGIMQALQLRAADPTFDQVMMQSGKRFNLGEAYTTVFRLITDNDKIIEDITPEDQAMNEQAQMEQMQAEQMQMEGEAPQEQPMMEEGGQPEPSEEEVMANMQAVMEEYGVSEEIAATMLEAERQGYDPEEIKQSMMRNVGGEDA